jgi:hypothetical protein
MHRRAITLLLLTIAPAIVHAEPYIAIREGLPCSICHVNPTGGGLRTVFGDIYAQQPLIASPIDVAGRAPWTGNLNDMIRAGGDFRYDGSYTKVPNQKTTDEFAVDDLRVYVGAEVIPNRLMLYVDQLLAPGASQTREAWAALWSPAHRYYVKAGHMYLPFGLRLQDDEAFVQQTSGINYTTPDSGVELGFDAAPWSAQLTVSNGAGGGSETDQGKQATTSVAYVQPRWRAGGSFAFNNASAGNRRMAALFGGFKTGPVGWLLEADAVADAGFTTGTRKFIAGIAEADWMFLRGHNLKVSAEYLDPDRDVPEDQRNRYSVVWEFAPIQFLQTRVGVRRYGGIPQNDLQNRREGFVELHLFF